MSNRPGAPIVREQPAITQTAIDPTCAEAGVRIGALAVALAQATSLRDAARDTYNNALHELDEWKDADKARQKFNKATKEARQDIADAFEVAHNAMADTKDGRTLAKARDQVRGLRKAVERATHEGGQLLMPFVAGAVNAVNGEGQ